MKVSADVSKCCGSGNCVMHVPEVFQQDEVTGLVKLLNPEPEAALWARVQAAADACPVGAIAAGDA